MKKLLIKDKNLRINLKKLYKKVFVLKSLIKNKYLFKLIHFKAILLFKNLSKLFYINAVSTKCVQTFNKKNFNKFTFFSRFFFLKLIRNGKILGIKKAAW